jgi:hypothetical protein
MDLSVLKAMSAIRPIATLGSYPRKRARFDKFYLERVEAYGSQRTGIVLSVNTTPHVIEQFDIKPNGTVLVRGQFGAADRDALLIKPERKRANHVVAVTDTICAMRFQYARFTGVIYPIDALQNFFHELRRVYCIAKEMNGYGKMSFPLNIGSVKVEYTSIAQIEATLYPMAYHFFKDDTEL